jgi:hypothetical protein
MLGKHSGQISIFDHMIYEKIIPKDHILIKINEIFDFSFVYDLIEDHYSPVGRLSIDPLILIKNPNRYGIQMVFRSWNR